jgi:beta-phosphoglucomutase family hydrolase
MDKLNHSDRGVLWDMDGVLVDTGELHFQAWKQTFTEFGFPFSREFFMNTFGMNNAGIMALVFGHQPDPALFATISDQKEKFFRQIIHGRANPLPGVKTCLTNLQKLGYRQAVASSAPMANIEALLDEIQIRSFFSELVSAYDIPGKPDPAVFIEAAQRLGLPPRSCVVVEDSFFGITAAHRAGMKCLAVTTTYPLKDLTEADRIVESLEQLKIEDFNL